MGKKKCVLVYYPSKWFICITYLISCTKPNIYPGVNKKPKKFKTVWHGFRIILKLSGRVNQARLKLSAGFSNTVCWTSKTCFCVANCLIWLLVEKSADSFKRAWFTLPDSFKIIRNPCQTILNFFGFLFTPAKFNSRKRSLKYCCLVRSRIWFRMQTYPR